MIALMGVLISCDIKCQPVSFLHLPRQFVLRRIDITSHCIERRTEASDFVLVPHIDANRIVTTRYQCRCSCEINEWSESCLLYTSPSPRDRQKSRMPSSA